MVNTKGEGLVDAPMLILSDADITRSLDMGACLDALRIAYRELGEGVALNRPRTDNHIPTARPGEFYRFKTFDGAVPGLGVLALRIDSDLVSWPVINGNRRQVKSPVAGGRYFGLVWLFEIDTGRPLAIMHDHYIQRMRVGATNGLAADYLARRDATKVGMLGSGWQAGAQIMALAAVRSLESVRVFSPNRAHLEAFCLELRGMLDLDVRPAASPEEAIDGADIAVTATNSMQPVVFGDWLRPGMHLSSIKQWEVDQAGYQRPDVTVLNARSGKGADLFTAVVDRDEIPYLAEGGLPYNFAGSESWPELADLATGRHPGRTGSGEVTFFLNNIGIGIQFAAAGAAAYRRARELGLGHEVPDEWFLQEGHS